VERNRLLLVRLFARPANLLVLDEPTNDLDIGTLEILKAMLLDFPGTLILVSHDRALLDNLVTSTLILSGYGRVIESVGGYADWRQSQAQVESVREPATQQKKKVPPCGNHKRPHRANMESRFTSDFHRLMFLIHSAPKMHHLESGQHAALD